MRRSLLWLSAGLTLLSTGAAFAQNNNTPHNLILFVPDGLRAMKVTPDTAPAMAAVRDKGVNFKNPHSMFPTFTTANASAMATGHYLGDTGDFSNTIYTGFTSVPAGDTVVPFLENDAVLGDVDEHSGGDYLNEETILKLARAKGFSTAAIGKLGPTLIFDHTDRADKPGLHSIVIDDSTGGKTGVPLSRRDEGRTDQGRTCRSSRPSRGDNGKAGDAKTPGTHGRQHRSAGLFRRRHVQGRAADVQDPQQAVRAGVLVARSRRQPAQSRATASTRSRPASTARPRWPASRTPTTTSRNCARPLDELGLADDHRHHRVAADHGFSTISKESATSPRPKRAIDDTPKDFLPMGFLAIDLAQGARACRCSIPTTRTRAVADERSPQGAATACSARIPPSPTSWSPPMADRT